ncbi:hypothetical protein MHLP_02120 [Candidatus Mycoplasma haematolamae str. Purdue]|uniref:Uncharacterized protein n=1 Tax=Mycoplasma haematolamae (strain Purdue) TaxID=1212765 RepID=I7CJH8_MYCHA|nr:hypothetical protein [Candidatus Mycoplasma haematolamae]AFO52004.1 hypothetical protein MHLP_02120 [Candidatus Mycoplasma haematolamae str. Purdue]
MALPLSTKIVVAAVCGSGTVVGGGYGVFQLASTKSPLEASVNQKSQETTEAQVTEGRADQTISDSSSEVSRTGLTGQEDHSSIELRSDSSAQLDETYEEEDEDDEQEQKESGMLFLVKGEDNSVNEGFQLEVYYDGESPSVEDVVVSGIAFQGVKQQVKKCVELVNTGILLWESKLPDYLDELKKNDTKLKSAFGDSVYETLISEIQKKIDTQTK